MIAESAVLSWNDFNGITVHSSESAFKKFHENDLQQWYRLLLRSSGFLNLGLHERIAITLLELSSDFGIKESRGTLLRASFSHQDIADLVGASRPRVTEHLAQLEREHLVIRQGRQLIVCADMMGNAIGVPPSGEARSQGRPSGKEHLASNRMDDNAWGARPSKSSRRRLIGNSRSFFQGAGRSGSGSF